MVGVGVGGRACRWVFGGVVVVAAGKINEATGSKVSSS